MAVVVIVVAANVLVSAVEAAVVFVVAASSSTGPIIGALIAGLFLLANTALTIVLTAKLRNGRRKNGENGASA